MTVFLYDVDCITFYENPNKFCDYCKTIFRSLIRYSKYIEFETTSRRLFCLPKLDYKNILLVQPDLRTYYDSEYFRSRDSVDMVEHHNKCMKELNIVSTRRMRLIQKRNRIENSFILKKGKNFKRFEKIPGELIRIIINYTL
jgi:hypothetical protein